MHHNKQLIDTKTVFYGFASYSEYRKFDSLKQALTAKSIYTFQETIGYWENLGYRNIKCTYKIFDDKGKEVDRVVALHKGRPNERWEIIGPRVEMNQYFQVQNIHFSVKDPAGNEWSLETGGGHPGIANAMNYLDSARKYYSSRQHEFELYSELRNLKKISLEPVT